MMIVMVVFKYLKPSCAHGWYVKEQAISGMYNKLSTASFNIVLGPDNGEVQPVSPVWVIQPMDM